MTAVDKAKELASLSKDDHLLYKVLKWSNGSKEEFTDNRKLTMSIEEADIITSQLADKPGYHTFMVDLDVPARLIPSSTEGHSHLYVDVEMTWEKYQQILCALAGAGIIQKGYYLSSLRAKLTSLRLPWVRK